MNRIDLIGILGVACLAFGAGWIYPPAGLITLGALLLTFSLQYTKRNIK